MSGLLITVFGLGGVLLVATWIALLGLAVGHVAAGRGGDACCTLFGLVLPWSIALVLLLVLPLLLAAGVVARRRAGRSPQR